MVSRSEAILNGSADTEVSDSAKAFQEQDNSKTRPKRATVKKVITEDSLPESEEDRLDHIAGIGGVKDLEATWSTPSPSTSKRVHPVSFSTLYIIYIYYIIYMVYAMYMLYVYYILYYIILHYILYILHHAIYFTCYLINVILLHFTANPVFQIENRMDPTEVGRLNKSNLPQSDESIGAVQW